MKSDNRSAGLTPTQVGATVVLGGVLAIAICVVVALSSVPPTVLDFPTSFRQTVHTVVPEGWGFFTKDPQDPEILPYKLVDERWRLVQRQGAWHPDTVFGWDRVAREQGLELGLLSQQVPRAAWLNCTNRPETCLSEIPVELRVTDAVADPTMCGTAAIVWQTPLPWSDAHASRDVIEPSSIAKFSVSCSHT